MAASNVNATGGYLNRGAREYMVRCVGRLQGIDDIENVVVKGDSERPVLLRQVARVVEGPEAETRRLGRQRLAAAVMLTITKQPGADTRVLTDQITAALEDLKATLPADIHIAPERLPAEVVHRTGHPQRDRRPARRRHPGGRRFSSSSC